MKANIAELKGDAALRRFFTGKGPHLLQMHADRCVPCAKVAPILEALAEEFLGRMRFGKINIGESALVRDMMEEFGIIGVPAVMILGNGKCGTLVGYRGRREYREAIEVILEPEEPAQETAREGCGCPMHC